MNRNQSRVSHCKHERIHLSEVTSEDPAWGCPELSLGYYPEGKPHRLKPRIIKWLCLSHLPFTRSFLCCLQTTWGPGTADFSFLASTRVLDPDYEIWVRGKGGVSHRPCLPRFPSPLCQPLHTLKIFFFLHLCLFCSLISSCSRLTGKAQEISLDQSNCLKCQHF